jgi:hypothetical protein
MLRVLEVKIIGGSGSRSISKSESAMKRSCPHPATLLPERAGHSVGDALASSVAAGKAGDKVLGPVIWDHEIVNTAPARTRQVLPDQR